jgi:integrase
LKKAGIRYRIPYQTRHTFASQMMAAGENHGFIAQQMGHEDIGVTLKYYARFIQNSGIKHGSKLEVAYETFKAKQVQKAVKNCHFTVALKIISL